MLRTLSFSVALFAALSSNAQNLVQNPGFETTTQCPVSLNELNKAVGWDIPTGATADVFNSCSANAGIPSNLMGNQAAATGNGYGGLMSFGWGDTYVEYMQGHLSNMQVGQHYRVSIKVSLAENGSSAGTSGLGILFRVDSLGTPYTFDDLLPYTPQVDYSSYGAVSNTTGWVTLADTFQADSSYKFLTIGRFQPSNQVEVDTLVTGTNPGSYYYIDDVTVEHVTLDVAHHTLPGVSVYPNPLVSASVINFMNAEKEPYTFCLYNVQGQLIRTMNGIYSGNLTVERNDMPSGLYFFQLKSSTNAYTGKLLVE